ncbi:MAG TPA: MinD/ParA family protein [Deltaproteobacteria bacterium]|nr:MinD/ParA family protein [Deltaproteobacteria bacterium]
MKWFGRFRSGGRNDGLPDGVPERERRVARDAKRRRIWAVGGGKGGVGKSFIASSLGLLLARDGARVLLVDADLGASNLHTFLGMNAARQTLSNFLKGRVSDIRELVTATGYENLDIVCGARDSLDVADMGGPRLGRLERALHGLDYDNIILDIGPGTSSNMLDMFLFAGLGILVTTPEPTSIENTYRYLKCLFARQIRRITESEEDLRLKSLLRSVFNSRSARTIADIFVELRRMDPGGEEMVRGMMAETRISLLVNQARRDKDGDIGRLMQTACYNYFGMDVGYAGHVSYEGIVSDAVRARKPFVIGYPGSETAAALQACLVRIGHWSAEEVGF